MWGRVSHTRTSAFAVRDLSPVTGDEPAICAVPTTVGAELSYAPVRTIEVLSGWLQGQAHQGPGYDHEGGKGVPGECLPNANPNTRTYARHPRTTASASGSRWSCSPFGAWFPPGQLGRVPAVAAVGGGAADHAGACRGDTVRTGGCAERAGVHDVGAGRWRWGGGRRDERRWRSWCSGSADRPRGVNL